MIQRIVRICAALCLIDISSESFSTLFCGNWGPCLRIQTIYLSRIKESNKNLPQSVDTLL